DRPGLGLAVLVADCAPVLVADPVAGLTGGAHSGRPGTEAGGVPALIEAMAARGADPARRGAGVGPAAGRPRLGGPAGVRGGGGRRGGRAPRRGSSRR